MRRGMPTIPDFTSPAWQQSQHELEITHRIQDGFEPKMPAYRDKLTEQQILALAIYVRHFWPEPAKPGTPKPVQPSAGARMPAVQIYRSYCLGCHDADGRGKIAPEAMRKDIPDFTAPRWQAQRIDADLENSILNGKGQFMLPMKDKLSPADAKVMAALVREFAKGNKPLRVEPEKPVVPTPPEEPKVVPSPKEKPPVREKPESPGRSAELARRLRAATGLYRQYCLICHGPKGTGSDMRRSMPPIPDFTQRGWQDGVTNPQLTASILDGKGTFMPAFRGRVGDKQAADLVAYIRAFGPSRPQRVETPATDFEKRYRELEEEWKELQRQLDKLSPRPR
jgi:mono/diheme cytochrome c family protein